MTTQDIIQYARSWAWQHNVPAGECYPVIRDHEVVKFYCRDRGFFAPNGDLL